ncbi:hypothetical protein SAMN05216582_1522 [Selenomonas ruminantium]|uniref:Uncharacterized protein n=1 Tax=Selenomonas ruminantium TaxID=971 RepID=A0A1M6Y1Q9_SELRU|nr:hypothetical protein [Selenomonas ruminantium]SHL12094.1 hypothetical protein SAMN05216582_1522 [Selenomonas ruminantium]
MIAVVLILLAVAVIYLVSRKNRDKEEMSNRQRVYIVPLKSVTTLSLRFFNDDDTRNRFRCMLLQAVFTCMAEQSKVWCADDEWSEARQIIVDFYDTLKATTRKSFKSEVDFNVLYGPILELQKNAGVRYRPNDILLPVIQAFRHESQVSDEYFVKLMNDWYNHDFLRFSDLNAEFKRYVIIGLKGIN